MGIVAKTSIPARTAWFASLVAAMVLALMLAGCSGSQDEGEGDGFVGHWTCCMVDAGNGQVIAIGDLGELELTGDDFMTLDLAEDGTATMTANGAPITEGIVITWSETSLGIELDAGSAGTIPLTYDSSMGQLIMEYQGQRIVFEKSKES